MRTNIEQAAIDTQIDIDEEADALEHDMAMADADDVTLEEFYQRREAKDDTAYWLEVKRQIDKGDFK